MVSDCTSAANTGELKFLFNTVFTDKIAVEVIIPFLFLHRGPEATKPNDAMVLQSYCSILHRDKLPTAGVMPVQCGEKDYWSVSTQHAAIGVNVPLSHVVVLYYVMTIKGQIDDELE